MEVKVEKNHDELKQFAFNLLLYSGFKRKDIEEEQNVTVKDFNGKEHNFKVDVIGWWNRYEHSPYRGWIIECGSCPAERETLLRTEFIVTHLPYYKFPVSMTEEHKDITKEILNYSKSISDSINYERNINEDLKDIIIKLKNKDIKEIIKEEVEDYVDENSNIILGRIESTEDMAKKRIDIYIEKKLKILSNLFGRYVESIRLKTNDDLLLKYKQIINPDGLSEEELERRYGK